MKISLIVAATENGVIGRDNSIPWRLPADVKFFKEKTWGHCVVTGRKNYESIPDKFRPLPGRTNIVVTRDQGYHAPGAHVVHSVESALELAKAKQEDECFIIGGAEIFNQTLPQADTIYLTRIKAVIEGDTFFPDPDPKLWKISEEAFFPADEKNPYDFSILTYVRT